MTTTIPSYVLRIEHDSDCESPLEFDNWRFCSFSRRHNSFVDPDELELNSLGMRRKFACGTAFMLSYYEHGNCAWSLLGAGQQCQWDTVNGAGVLIWQGKAKDLGATVEKRREVAAAVLENYTDWCNGNCYWYSLEDSEGETVDSCGGFIGEKWLAEYVNKQALCQVDERAEIEIVGDSKWIADYHEFKGRKPAEVAEREYVAREIGAGL